MGAKLEILKALEVFVDNAFVLQKTGRKDSGTGGRKISWRVLS